MKVVYTAGLVARAQGHREEARERFERALAIGERLGEGLYRPHVERALADPG